MDSASGAHHTGAAQSHLSPDRTRNMKQSHESYVNNAMNIRPVVALKDSAAQMLNNSSIVMTPKRLLASPSGERMQN